MNPQIVHLLRTSRVLAVVDRCSLCLQWKHFIERLNLEVPMEKKVRIIDFTRFNILGIADDPLIEIFEKYISNFPVLFFQGVKLDGANSQEECEAFIRGALHKDFIIERENPLMFNKNCRYKKKRFRKVLICGEEE